ncbi:hypothetical protein JZ751_025920 [Albula glossodonta]|uniref:Long-chain-fatty-acid--CoA ligase n=1 Tax=Albula glossodonta TaxID=121402 RepID=A0A8T2NHE4_9TELE|nr:hypothetical protein JZ751_025920 [Albula glossodonta]
METLFNFLFTPLPTSALVSLFVLAATALVWLNTRPKPVRPPVDLNRQTVGIQVRGRCTQPGNGPCLGYRKKGQPYQWLKYKQVSDRAQHLGSGLLHRGLTPSSDSFIGIFAQNRPEWIISELACYTYSMVVVPLYDTLGPEALVFIVNRADISTVLCDKQEKAEVLLGNCEKQLTPVLKTIILMDPFGPDLIERGSKCGVQILSMKEVEDLGKDNKKNPVPPKPEDLSIVCFTSGTTGDPKGAMLTHENVVSDAAGVVKSFESAFAPLPTDVSISFLPLAHMFERVVQTVLYSAGGRVGFFQGDIKLLPDDMKTLQPTIFPVVPRLLNRVYDKVQSGAQSPFKKWLLNFAIERKHSEVKQGIIRNNSVWDKLIFHKVQESLGGRVRVMVTGAAPISPSVLQFLRACLGCQIFEAYGQTECTAGCTFSAPGDWTSGRSPTTVCVKGKNVFKGYLKDEEKTAEAMDEEAKTQIKHSKWTDLPQVGTVLPSGAIRFFPGYPWTQRNVHPDKCVPCLLSDGLNYTYHSPSHGTGFSTYVPLPAELRSGVLKIIDRKKNIFKLAQGEYIAPEKIENAFLVGIVVPDPDVLPGFAAKLGATGSLEELCKNQKVKKAIHTDLMKLGREAGLKSFEQVKDIYVHPEQFSIENGLLTPTLKAKRADLTKFFKMQIANLYASNN